jgi:hypothetical protein
MEGRNSAPLAVSHKDGNAIGRLHSQQQTGLIGHDSIGFPGALTASVASGSPDQDVRVNLADGNQRRCCISGNCLGHQPSILADCHPVISGRESKIQFALCIVSAIRPADAPLTRAEPVPEPGRSSPARRVPTRNRNPMNSIGHDNRYRSGLIQLGL